jgi:hypothetical protein
VKNISGSSWGRVFVPEMFGSIPSTFAIIFSGYYVIYLLDYATEPDYEIFSLIFIFFYVVSMMYEIYFRLRSER